MTIDAWHFCPDTLNRLFSVQDLHEDMLPYSPQIDRIRREYNRTIAEARDKARSENASFLFAPLQDWQVHRALIAMRKAGRLEGRQRVPNRHGKSHLIDEMRDFIASQCLDVPIDKLPYSDAFNGMLLRFNERYKRDLTLTHRRIWLETIRLSKRGMRQPASMDGS